ncbi:MAG: hypothetical protein LBK99_24610 [Opitutaceae bacterium]|jgi:hypothetical protein|nr:hypothetical protein [Opitutaceae bacterium]
MKSTRTTSRRFQAGIAIGLVALVALAFVGAWWWRQSGVRPTVKDEPARPVHSHSGHPGKDVSVDAKPEKPQRLAAWQTFAASHSILPVVTDNEWPYPERHAAVNELAAVPLTPELLDACFDYLRSPVPQKEEDAVFERAVRNDMLNVLRTRTLETLELVPVLIGQAADPAQDTALRDYALQHLSSWAPRLPEKEQQMAVDALRETLMSTELSYAGTALLGLHDMSTRATRMVPVPDVDLPAEAIRIATDEATGLHSRIGALALCNQMQVRDEKLAALARNWTTNKTLPEPARRAATAYLSTRNH